MKKQLFCIFFHVLDKYPTPISRDPDEMILGFIDGMCTFSEFYADHIIGFHLVWIAATSPDRSLEFSAAE